jgi:hypothetical protein
LRKNPSKSRIFRELFSAAATSVPAWQRRGVGVRWLTTEKNGIDPRTQRAVPTLRRVLSTELELPMKAAALEYLRDRAREAVTERSSLVAGASALGDALRLVVRAVALRVALALALRGGVIADGPGLDRARIGLNGLARRDRGERQHHQRQEEELHDGHTFLGGS